MRIVVYNFNDQYALSRGQVKIISATLPKEYFAPIREFHICSSPIGPEKFEFKREQKIAYFAYPIKQKTDIVVKDAIRELLIGLIRIKAKSKFGNRASEEEKNEYRAWIDEWTEKCFTAIKAKKPAAKKRRDRAYSAEQRK